MKKQYENIQNPLIEKQPVIAFIDKITTKTKNLLEQHISEDIDKSDYLNDDDFIVSNNYVQWITKKGNSK